MIWIHINKPAPIAGCGHTLSAVISKCRGVCLFFLLSIIGRNTKLFFSLPFFGSLIYIFE